MFHIKLYYCSLFADPRLLTTIECGVCVCVCVNLATLTGEIVDLIKNSFKAYLFTHKTILKLIVVKCVCKLLVRTHFSSRSNLDDRVIFSL